MFQILKAIFKVVMEEGDKRTFDLPLTNPWWPFGIFFIYVFIVKFLGPRFMKNRKPFDLKAPILIYNALQVALSTYLFIQICEHGWLSIFNWFKCKPIEVESNPTFIKLLNLHHWYYLSKYTEMIDTVFFVLRKKYNQVSFLHVYHHGTMPFFTCLTMRFSPGSSITFIGFLNTFVHIVMYGYYMLAALGPQVHKYLWWKKYITSMQLTQFIILFFHFLIVLGSSCNVPKVVAMCIVGNTVINFALFYHFYNKEYKRNAQVKKQKEVSQLNGQSHMYKATNGESSQAASNLSEYTKYRTHS